MLSQDEFARLFSKHQRLLYAYLVTLLNDPASAEEVLQLQTLVRGVPVANDAVDFAVAISMGTLSSPGPLQLFGFDIPASQAGTYPTVMIPAFAVPSSILLHALSIRQLRRIVRRSTPVG